MIPTREQYERLTVIARQLRDANQALRQAVDELRTATMKLTDVLEEMRHEDD